MPDDRHVEDDPPAFTYDSLSLGLAILRAFVNRDRDEGLKLAQMLLDESAEPIRALETVADAASSALHMIGRARDVDVDATLTELAVRLAKKFNE